MIAYGPRPEEGEAAGMPIIWETNFQAQRNKNSCVAKADRGGGEWMSQRDYEGSEM